MNETTALNRRRRKPLFRSGVSMLATVILLACAACAHDIVPLADSRFPDDPQKEAELRCVERRGGEAFLPQNAFRTDGCTLWPDSEWQSCCVEHDMTYWCGGSSEERKESDTEIRRCVAETGHPVIGALMSGVIRVSGSRVFPTPWRWGYGWPWPRKMERDTE